MKKMNFPNLTLIVLVVSCLIQVGAQLFALSVVASTVAEAPPRSFAMLQGKYGYNSSSFWNTVPPITFLLFIVALVSNWKYQRRKYIVFAFTFFITGGLVAGFFLEPIFAEMIKRGYSDQVDPILQNQAKKWYIFDWIVWSLGLVAGLTLLIALIHPAILQVKYSTDDIKGPNTV